MVVGSRALEREGAVELQFADMKTPKRAIALFSQ